MKNINPLEINALIRLLDDNDKEIFQHIEDRLIHFGKEVIPILENAWRSSLDALMQERIEAIIHRIQFEDLQHQIHVWSHSGSQELVKGAILIARYQYPDLDEEAIQKQLDKMRKDAWLEMNDHLTAMEQVKVLNKIFFDIQGFNGNTQNYHAPQNSFINIALRRKEVTHSCFPSYTWKLHEVPEFRSMVSIFRNILYCVIKMNSMTRQISVIIPIYYFT